MDALTMSTSLSPILTVTTVWNTRDTGDKETIVTVNTILSIFTILIIGETNYEININ